MREDIKKRIEAVRGGEMPEGYQRTRAGMMPLDWQSNLAAKDIFRNHTNKKHNGELEVLSATQDRGIIPRSEVDIDIKYAEENIGSYKKVEAGDFVISLRSFQGGIEYSEYEGLVSPAYTVLKATKPISDNYYRAYFKTPDFISRLNGAVYGIRDGKQIGFEDFGELAVHYPPLAEQQKIAEILATCDRVIELKQQLLEEKRRQKQWLMQKLLDPNSAAIVERRLGDICSINDCGIDGLSGDSEIFYIDIASVDNGKVLFPESPVKLQDAPVRARRTFKRGDILMSTVRPYLHAFAFVDFDTKNYVASTGFSILRARNGVSSRLIYQLLFTAEMDKQYSSVLVGSNYPALNTSDVENLVVFIPESYEKQEAVANVLATGDQEIGLLSSEIEAWQQKKKALMQLLLTGLVRVNA